LFISARVPLQPFKVIQVIDVGSNRKRVCDFVLVRNSNLGPILQGFGDIAGFGAPWPHPYSTLILVVFPSHQIAHVGVSPRISLKLFDREIVFEEFQRMWSRYLNVTDRRTDDMQSHNHQSPSKHVCNATELERRKRIVTYVVIAPCKYPNIAAATTIATTRAHLHTNSLIRALKR